MSDKISAPLKVYAAMPCLDGIAMPGINVVQRPVDGGYFAPLLIHIAQAQVYNPAVLGLIWTIARGAHLFVYQSGALVVGYSYSVFSAKDLFKVALAVTVLNGLLLMIVVPLYWPLIGLSWIE